MRRIWATLLVAVFGFAPIAPALFLPTGDQKLPPCCRKNGKHHCAAQRQEGTSGASLQTGRCAFFVNEQALPPISATGVPKAGQAVVAAVLTDRTPRPQTEKLGGASFDRTGQKRGPPSLS
jgi:hypothetical protein